MMWSNSLGKRFVITSYGESHGPTIGIIIDGCPAGLELTEGDIQPDLDRRRPGQHDITTPRKELDQVQIHSGTLDSRTTGAPICAEVRNTDIDSSFYKQITNLPRPGHADYVARMKYGPYVDLRGGGRFSGRITIAYVIAGAIAKKLLRKINSNPVKRSLKTQRPAGWWRSSMVVILNQKIMTHVHLKRS